MKELLQIAQLCGLFACDDATERLFVSMSCVSRGPLPTVRSLKNENEMKMKIWTASKEQIAQLCGLFAC